MKSIHAWRELLADLEIPQGIQHVKGRSGEFTLKVGNVYLHSVYQPREEAARLIESAALDFTRPVLIIGLGLGYHVLELLDRKAMVAVVEPDRAVAKLALDGPLRDVDLLLGLGDPDAIARTDAFEEFARRMPQVLVHPPTARIHPAFIERMTALVADKALATQRLSIAVVGPMYGGSLPIAGYLERAFQRLGHRTLRVDNRLGQPLCNAMTKSVQSPRASAQLTQLLAQFLGEWSYARVAEFSADLCIVLAQAPVDRFFAARLAQHGIVTAFWFVENWRHLSYWQEIASQYDYFFHVQPGDFERKLSEVGCHHHAFVQTGCDPEVHRPVVLTEEERAAYACDISFAGAGYPNRNQLLSGLTDYDLAIWGINWNARELARCVRRRDEWFGPEDFARIVAGSKINLNLHASTTCLGVDPRADAINPRVFEIAACGGFQLCDPCAGLDAFFEFESELPVYRDLAELRRKIDRFLAHPEERVQIAQRARERALRDHTYDKRAQQMLHLLLEAHGGRILKKGICVQRTVAETADRVGRTTPLGQYLASLPPDTLFTQESINEQLRDAWSKLTYPETVFAYLREVRNSAETLLAER